jgi:hypothetical protein
MKRSLLAWAIAMVGAMLAANTSRAQAPAAGGADLGPGAQGATLRQPWEVPGGAAPLPGLWNAAAGGSPPPLDLGLRRAPLPAAVHDLNKDIEVTPVPGPWLISITAYFGPEAPLKARQMVAELREKYKLPAYVFNSGAEERRKQMERVKAQLDQQHELVRRTKEKFGEHQVEVRKIYVKTIQSQTQDNCAVLVGGYPDEVAARRALDAVRALNPNQLNRALLDMKFYGNDDPKSGKIERFFGGGGPQARKNEQSELVYVNPFTRAFVVPNPTIKREHPKTTDVAALRKLNAGQPYSLFDCKKRFTLAIKHFPTPTELQQPTEGKAGGFLSSLKGNATSHQDYAAENATNLAKALRQSGMEAYVLHTRYASIVTVGAYDSVDDPSLRSMQNILVTQLRPRLEQVQLLPQPLPMEVPR